MFLFTVDLSSLQCHVRESLCHAQFQSTHNHSQEIEIVHLLPFCLRIRTISRAHTFRFRVSVGPAGLFRPLRYVRCREGRGAGDSPKSGLTRLNTCGAPTVTRMICAAHKHRLAHRPTTIFRVLYVSVCQLFYPPPRDGRTATRPTFRH